MVTGVREGELDVGNQVMPAAVILWAAGVLASPLGKALGVPTDKAGRVLVEPDLSIPGHSEVFVIGDLASIKYGDGKLVPGLAPAAMQEGKWVGRMIKADLKRKPRTPFHYRDKGTLATIGRAAAVAELPGGIHISGYLAWLAWLFIHIFFLIGFRNRLAVMFDWAWSYFTYKRSARLITGESRIIPIATIAHMEEASLHVAHMEAKEGPVLAKKGA
jgi:NADH dehydrogenase